MCASARAGDSVRVTMRGGAPWGFQLQDGKEHHGPLVVSQVDSGGRAAQAGLLEGDEVASLNGEPASDLAPQDIAARLEGPADSLELLVRRLRTQDEPRYWGKEKESWAPGVELSREIRSLKRFGKGAPSPAGPVQLGTSDCRREFGPDLDTRGSGPGVLRSATSSTRSLYIYSTRQERVGQGGRLAGSSCSLGQVEVTLQRPWGGGELSISRTEARGRVSPPKEGGNAEAPPASVSFGISAEGDASAEQWDSESERDLGPRKHRARHARFRRSESQSEKQLKEAKSKCRRIALLLTAAPNPNNKGVLMFEKHRQRARQYTLVSYGTGEEEPWSDEEEEEEQNDRTVRITFVATDKPQLNSDSVADAQGSCSAEISDLASQQLVVEKKPDSLEEMEHLPATKGKGALMFARRRQRVDEIAAAHEEMRSKGIPVEGPAGAGSPEPVPSYQVEEHPNKLYGDSQSGELSWGIKHQQYQEQQTPIQQYSPTVNGVAHQQPSEMQRSLVANRMAQPFSGVPNRVPAPFSPSRSITALESDQPGYSDNTFRVVPPPVPVITRPQVLSPTDQEQMVSRDERIAVPAIKTVMLQDTKKRSTAKMAFASNELLKASQTSQLLNAPKSDKKAGFESGAEEDYLSLGAEACNFLQTPTVKHKTPPPVAPKPSINLASPPWLTENTTQAQSEIPSPAAAPPVASPMQPRPPQQHATLSTWAPPELHPPRQQSVSAWAPAQTKAEPQLPSRAWGSSLQEAQAQAPVGPWAQPHAPASMLTPRQPAKSWNPPYISANSMASHLSQTAASKAHLMGSVSSARAVSPASDMPTMRGRGAELFARRQSRMEKFVVDSETVQANKARSQSPTPSLPSTWKYSPNVRAPPPSSYNPLLTPSYPPGAIKQHPASSVQTKANSKPKAKQATKHLNSLDVMKHQPYQLNVSLFTYNPTVEAKATTAPSPTSAPAPASQLMKPVGPGVNRSHSLSLPRRLPSMSSTLGFESPLTTPVFQPSYDPMQRQSSWMEKSGKPSSPWGFQPESAGTQHGPPFRKYQSQRSVPENSPRYGGAGADVQAPISQPNYTSVCNASWRR
ncbi:synaptopodin-2-like isoform X1 [Scleropages formosus]|uniref:synaptopodin-2-like isoform X1 n=1 Tax=Scleropages formosus TaxID=113540 RepID=UPI0010FA6778|nr:synaptopodin-2-like isoform X1 [Scleropages formosus]